ncbi:MAG: EAL domain-containing protein [Piscinibacter sp.]
MSDPACDLPPAAGTAADRLRRLEARLDRERRARLEAERLLESKSLELYQANRTLSALATDLEQRVADRTRELSDERQRALERAEIDALTGIANRACFARRLRELLADPQSRGEGLVALLIDLDDFKNVNDTLGHAAGDALLIETAHRLSEAMRPGDLVARLGGDEFAVIARRVGTQTVAQSLARRLLETLSRPALIDGRSVPCSCSIGVAEAQGGDADELLRAADLALYASKRAGRGRVTEFESSLRADIERRAVIEAEVRRAVLGDCIQPWYQPIVRVAEGRHVGAELLARWHLPDGEVRSPAAFLGTVEALGLLDVMMENMLRRALHEAAPAALAGTLEYLSINVSPTQFNQGWAQQRLPRLLAEAGFPPHALLVEITETALIQDIDRTRDTLAALTASGMRIALDDFGVGYSNFSLLRQLPFHVLKLDRTLIQDIETDEQARALAECILSLANRLNIKVVAEGVETARQAEMLSAAGCAALQGYWFARPQRTLSTWFDSGAAERLLSA